MMKQKDIGRRLTDTLKQEAERGVTIKSTAVSVQHCASRNKKTHCVNVIDSPGHIDFSSEVTAALRATDGAIVVVCALSGCECQTKTVLSQALEERVKPVLCINKIDRLVIEQQKTKEETYGRFQALIRQMNDILSTNRDTAMGDIQVDPLKGSVCFSSGFHGFAFTLQSVAARYAGLKKNKGLKVDRFIKKLWGEWYWDGKKNKVVKKKKSENGDVLDRTFVHFCLDPIYRVYGMFDSYDLSKEEEKKEFESVLCRFLKDFEIKISVEERKENLGKALRNLLLQRLFPAAPCLLDMIVECLPSPIVAQKYRYERLYSGDLNDEFATAIKNCDPTGPLIFYVSKQVEITKRLVCFGRVFSGTLKSGSTVYVIKQSSTDENGHEEEGEEEGEGESSKKKKGKKKKGKKKKNFPSAGVQSLYVMLAKNIMSVSEIGAGSVVGVTGIEKHIVKTATVSDTCDGDPKPIKAMNFSVSPVVRIGIESKKQSDLKKLLAGLKRLVRLDPLLEFTVDEKTKQMILAGAGEFHLETALELLTTEYCKGLEIRTSPMIVSFKETLCGDSPDNLLAKSKNSHNRVYLRASPLQEKVVKMLESGELTKRNLTILRNHGWHTKEIKSIWAIGPEGKNSCILVNSSKGVPYMNEVKDSLIGGFLQGTKEGVLGKEEMRGVRFDIVDGQFHSDTSHRGGGQVIPTMRKVMFGAFLSSSPRLVEPIYQIEITVPKTISGKIHSTLKKRRGIIENVESSETIMTNVVISGFLPVLESFGVVREIRKVTSGQAFTSLSFSHWEMMNGCIVASEDEQVSEKIEKIVLDIRRRKKMKEEMPVPDDYLDRL